MTCRPTALLAGLLLCAACDRGVPAVDFRHNPARKGTPVVRFGEDSITAEELQQRFAEMNPATRARYQTLEQKKEYLEGLLRFELLAREALARGMQNDPEVVETAKKVMVQRLLQKELEEQGAELPDAELADYYEKHKADYVRPPLVRLFDVFLAAPASDAAARERKRAQAQAAREKAAALDAMDFGAFGRLARELSEDPRSRVLDGDLRFLSAAELEARYGPEVARAAEALDRVGALSGVVETGSGFHVLKLQGRQAALNLAFADVKPQLRSRLLYERRVQRHERFLAELERKYQVRVDGEALAGVKVDLQAPAREARGLPPGFVAPPPRASAPSAAPPPSLPGDSRAQQPR